MKIAGTRGGDPVSLPAEVARLVADVRPMSEREVAEEKARVQQAAAFAKRREWEAALRAACPDRPREVVLREMRDTPATGAVERWLANPARHLMLRGEMRCGKSVAAALAVYRWVEPLDVGVRKALWLDPEGLISAMLHPYDQERSPQLSGVSLVVVDDVGTEARAGFQQALRKLLDRADIHILITSNMDRLTMRETYNHRLLWRLLETTDAVDLAGEQRELPAHGDF